MKVLLVKNEHGCPPSGWLGLGPVLRRATRRPATWQLRETFDAIVLGVTDPDATSLRLCHELSQRVAGNPDHALVARDIAAIRIQGLDTGDDDCVSLSCPAEELLARLRALVRRSGLPRDSRPARSRRAKFEEAISPDPCRNLSLLKPATKADGLRTSIAPNRQRFFRTSSCSMLDI